MYDMYEKESFDNNVNFIKLVADNNKHRNIRVEIVTSLLSECYMYKHVLEQSLPVRSVINKRDQCVLLINRQELLDPVLNY